jgi:hypothetical protein
MLISVRASASVLAGPLTTARCMGVQPTSRVPEQAVPVSLACQWSSDSRAPLCGDDREL